MTTTEASRAARKRRTGTRKDAPIWDCVGIAEYLGVHPQTVRRWIRIGTRIGRVIRKTEEGTYYAIPSELDAALKG